MPIPFAHPAAVLPLRRYCPRHLSFLALVVGSVMPDAGYAVGYFRPAFQAMLPSLAPQIRTSINSGVDHNWDKLSHDPVGCVLFSLPLGLLVVGLCLVLRSAFVATLPNPHRTALAPLCTGPRRTIIAYSLSLLIGVWSHVAWDSLTKYGGWLDRHSTGIYSPGDGLPLYRIVWLCSSILGVLFLLGFYVRFLRRSGLPFWSPIGTELRYYAPWLVLVVIAGAVAVPVSLHLTHLQLTRNGIYNFGHRFAGLFFIGCGLGAILITLAAWMRQRLRASKET